MPAPNFTQIAAEMWFSVGEPRGMSKTAFLDYLRSDAGGNLSIRTQTYYRMIGELQALHEQLPAEWNEPLNEPPTRFEPITRDYASPAYWYHTHILEWIPGETAADWIAVPHRYTVKSNQLLTRSEALEIAEEAMKWNQSTYGVEGSFISGGLYIGSWQPVRSPD